MFITSSGYYINQPDLSLCGGFVSLINDQWSEVEENPNSYVSADGVPVKV